MNIVLTEPERMVIVALIVSAFVQVAKLCIPLLNGWGAVAVNIVISTVMFVLVFHFDLTWTSFATLLLISLAAAGVHGTATKVGDYPFPHHNPTPSGTPAQNYRIHVE